MGRDNIIGALVPAATHHHSREGAPGNGGALAAPEPWTLREGKPKKKKKERKKDKVESDNENGKRRKISY